MKKALLLVMALTTSMAFAQDLWSPLSKSEAGSLGNIKERTFSETSKFFRLNLNTLTAQLQSAQPIRTGATGLTLSFPNTNGKLERFAIWENSNFDAELQAAHPTIRAYSGQGIEDKSATISISLSPQGIQTMILRNGRSEFTEAYTTDGLVYAVFVSNRRSEAFRCLTTDMGQTQEFAPVLNSTQSNAQTLKKFRLVVSVTAEYTAFFGGVNQALAGINATLTRVNGLYEKELAVKLELIANTTTVIFTNPNTDPYDDAEIGTGNSPSNGYDTTWNLQLQNTLTSMIGNTNYDIGHLFGASGGGGSAGCIGCVCVNPTTNFPAGKGSGFTSPYDEIPEGDAFDIDFVAHEIGHQLGATHTHSFGYEGGGTNGTQVEVASGSTIMGYAGVTGNYDIQGSSDDYFSGRSINQIQANLANKPCANNIALTNNAPVIDAGLNWTIPRGTPFKLTGSGSDPNGHTLSYCWEQADSALGGNATSGNNSFAYPTKPNGPNFRSFPPTTVPERYFPALEKVLANNLTSNVESVSNVARIFNFTLTGRDNIAGGGQTNSDGMTVTVSANAGPFDVTSQNAPNVIWNHGTTQTITWTVNNTTNLAGSTNVDILLSIDGGLTYPITLAANTPNDGSEQITVPNTPAPFCRVMVKPTGNIYYDVNTTSFAIDYIVTDVCNTYNSTAAIPIPDGLGTMSGIPGTIAFGTISVAENTTITDVNVGLNVSHTYPADLVIVLQHPDQTQVALWGNSCAGNDNFNITLSDGSPAFTCVANMTGTFAPVQPLAGFNTKPANGQWGILAADFFMQDTGQINSWSIEICSQTTTPLSVADFTLSSIILFPNPAQNVLNISVPQEIGLPDNFVIYNSIGQVIENRKVSASDELTVNTSTYSNGVYFVKVTQGQKTATLRFIKN